MAIFKKTFPEQNITGNNSHLIFTLDGEGYPKHSVIQKAFISFKDSCGFTILSPKSKLIIKSIDSQTLFTGPTYNVAKQWTAHKINNLTNHFIADGKGRNIVVEFTGTYRWWGVRDLTVNITYQPPIYEIITKSTTGGSVTGGEKFEIPATGEVQKIIKATPESNRYVFDKWIDESGAEYKTPEITITYSDNTINTHTTTKTYTAYFIDQNLINSQLYLGTRKITDIYCGVKPVKSVWVGMKKVLHSQT